MSKLIHWLTITAFVMVFGVTGIAQNQISGRITSSGEPLSFANVFLKGNYAGEPRQMPTGITLLLRSRTVHSQW